MKANGRMPVGYSRLKRVDQKSKLLDDMYRNVVDLNSPLLFIHNNSGCLTKLSIYS